MGIVGVNSTAGREVKFIDPSKTTKSESSWLGYTLCDYFSHILTQLFFFCAYHTHTHLYALKIIFVCTVHREILTLYNEERRLGDQRGSDTLVVPLITSNDGLSIAFILVWLQISSACKYLFGLSSCFRTRSPTFISYGLDVTFRLFTFSLRVSIIHYSLKHKILYCVHLIFGALRSILVRCKHYVILPVHVCNTFGWHFVVSLLHFNTFSVKHALGTRLLQKCLRHSPPGVVCTQVWNLKELTEGHHKNAWSMWLNLTQRGKSYRVRTHWGLTGNIIKSISLTRGCYNLIC